MNKFFFLIGKIHGAIYVLNIVNATANIKMVVADTIIKYAILFIVSYCILSTL